MPTSGKSCRTSRGRVKKWNGAKRDLRFCDVCRTKIHTQHGNILTCECLGFLTKNYKDRVLIHARCADATAELLMLEDCPEGLDPAAWPMIRRLGAELIEQLNQNGPQVKSTTWLNSSRSKLIDRDQLKLLKTSNK